MQRGSAEELGDLIDVTKFCAPSTSSFVEHKAAQKNSQIRTIQEDDQRKSDESRFIPQ
jgi:hypothetical protein